MKILLVENQELVLRHVPGFGAWTYHLKIPNSASIPGRWGELKLSGTIDGFEVKGLNLAPRGDDEKIVSINKHIRTGIGKTAGDVVVATLCLDI